MDVIRGVLFKHIMPILLICALVALIVSLIQLLLLFCAACFADHIRKTRIIAITKAQADKKLSMESGADRSRIMDDMDEDELHPGYMDEHLEERKSKINARLRVIGLKCLNGFSRQQNNAIWTWINTCIATLKKMSSFFHFTANGSSRIVNPDYHLFM